MPEEQTPPSIQQFSHNPMHWPAEILPVFEHVSTAEIATLTQRLVPIAMPLTTFPGNDEKTLDFSTGVVYPAKAERARRNPNVGVLFSDIAGYNLDQPPIVLVQGHARVCDADIQGNTDRYTRVLAKSSSGETFFGNASLEDIQNMMFYLARIWIKVTPLRIFWWPAGDTDKAPHIWQAPDGIQLLPSDPAPAGKWSASRPKSDIDWHVIATHAIQQLGIPVLATVDKDGYPLLMRAKQVTLTTQGFNLILPAGTPFEQHGPASLVFHTPSNRRNQTFVGQAVPGKQGTLAFIVEHPVGNGNAEERQSVAASEKSFAPRLSAEMARHSQPIPRAIMPEIIWHN